MLIGLTVNIGIIGCGTIAWYHLKAIQENTRGKVVAAYNRSFGPLEKLGDAAGIPRKNRYNDINVFFKNREIDAVVNCLPNSMHSSVSVLALETGLHVLCEKPMATSHLEAKNMIDAAKRNDKKLLIGLTRRFKGDSQAAKKLVNSGRLGEIYYSKCEWMRRNGIPGWGSQFTQRKLAGAGPIYDIGVHVLDLVCWLSSNFEAENVLASSYSKFGPYKKGLGDWGTPDFTGEFDVEDLASAHIEMRNGSTIAFEVSWAAHVPRSFFNVMLLGDQAGLDFDSMQLHSSNGGEIDEKVDYVGTDPYYEEMSHFFDCIQNDVEPLTTGHEMLELQKTLDMILLSCKEKKLVKANEI
jgi:predicted dehydrogenase